MAEMAQTSDMRTGVALLFGFIALLGAFATAATAYVAFIESSETMQLYSGIALSVAILAGCLVIVAIHVLE